MGICIHTHRFFSRGVCVLKTDLSYLCREAKEQHVPRLTNSDLAQLTGVSENAVAQFLRGETKNASVYTVGRICAALGVSLDAFFNIVLPVSGVQDELAKLQNQLTNTQLQLAFYKASDRRKGLINNVLLAFVGLFLFALILDVFNRNIGWIR